MYRRLRTAGPPAVGRSDGRFGRGGVAPDDDVGGVGIGNSRQRAGLGGLGGQHRTVTPSAAEADDGGDREDDQEEDRDGDQDDHHRTGPPDVCCLDPGHACVVGGRGGRVEVAGGIGGRRFLEIGFRRFLVQAELGEHVRSATAST